MAFPPVNFIKINIDGSKNRDQSAIGGVAKDHTGKFLFSFYEYIGKWPIFYMELYAIWAAINYCEKFNYPNIIIESNYLATIQILKRNKGFHWLCANMIMLIKSLTLKYNIQFNHIFREGNRAADYLANKGITKEGSKVFFYLNQDRHLRSLLRGDHLPFIRKR